MHTCTINDHVISKYKSPALDCNFLAGYLHKCFEIFEMIQYLNLLASMNTYFKRRLDVANPQKSSNFDHIYCRLPKCHVGELGLFLGSQL